MKYVYEYRIAKNGSMTIMRRKVIYYNDKVVYFKIPGNPELGICWNYKAENHGAMLKLNRYHIERRAYISAILIDACELESIRRAEIKRILDEYYDIVLPNNFGMDRWICQHNYELTSSELKILKSKIDALESSLGTKLT